jgi:hypothetical protein
VKKARKEREVAYVGEHVGASAWRRYLRQGRRYLQEILTAGVLLWPSHATTPVDGLCVYGGAEYSIGSVREGQVCTRDLADAAGHELPPVWVTIPAGNRPQ